MCGFAGFIDRQVLTAEQATQVLRSMAARLVHRGPDGEGLWWDLDAGVGLTHRRLAVVDLSHAGHQPMVSSTGRYVIVFNGEIYNHSDLRRALESTNQAPIWKGHSDTETLLAAIEAWGWQETLLRSVGMFAIALWDRFEKRLWLARDRLGEKPLYYGWQRGTLIFGSELKSLKAHPAFNADVDRGALALFLRHGYISSPYSIYEGIQKLPAGSWVCLSNSGDSVAPTRYWSYFDSAERGQGTPYNGNDAGAVSALEVNLTQSIALQRIADVPLGAFLSGGIDSSLVVALMQRQAMRPVKTFTIGFSDQGYDEAAYAKAVASHLGTEHTELYVTPNDALDVIPSLPVLFDEPFADFSQIPTYLVAKLARGHVTVALSGDGGDELFGGYNRYLWVPRIWNKLRSLPSPLRNVLACVLSAVPASKWDKVFNVVSPIVPGRLHTALPGDKLHKMAGILGAKSPQEIYLRLVSHWADPEGLLVQGHEPTTVLSDSSHWPPIDTQEFWMMVADAVTYLPDDILVKVDRAAMGVSLETRVPMLDHRLVEFACSVPLNMKIRNGQGKWLLRQLLHQYVPKELTERPKMGFGVPIGEWLRGGLRDWAEDLLDESRLRREGFLQPEPVRRAWKEHLSGRSHQNRLWNVLMFQSWLANQRANT